GAGSTFIEVSGKQLAKMPIKVPNIKEQKIIGAYFEKIDNLITLHQRKVKMINSVLKAIS
ncbi:MAG: restriction endonuclease subunit S, partial [Candidatus Izemoplasmatales bacterium]|nr:restriction endonuclease subunit S [Candidatus Izemoplasmatales bacterium]